MRTFQWMFHFHVQEIRWNRVCDKRQHFTTAAVCFLLSEYLCPKHTCKPKGTGECCILRNSTSCDRHNMPFRMAVYFIQGIHKRMLLFQKLSRNLFLTLHGHNVHRQQWQLPKFLMRYQQFTSRAYCRAAGLVSKMVSQQEKAFCVLRFEVSRSLITAHKLSVPPSYIIPAWCIFS